MSMQEFWAHARRFNWQIGAFWGHIYRLSDMISSTKELIEDLFGIGVDMQRSNRNPWKASSVEKLHHLLSHWPRLDGTEWPKLQTTHQDFLSTRGDPIRKHVNIGSHAPPSNLSSTFRLACIKKHKG